jgi:transcriptional regulator with PAS, ATPase and Fis domain
VDVRVLAATNKVPEDAVARGELRNDLYYRLNVFNIHMPVLREHRDDIPDLVQGLLREVNTKHSRQVATVSEAVLNAFRNYAWPGNVRELQNAIEYAVVLSRSDVIGVKELPAEIQLPPALQQTELGGTPRKGVQTLDDVERNAILQALAECRGNKKKAAELLGIQRPTLYNKLKRYAIEL